MVIAVSVAGTVILKKVRGGVRVRVRVRVRVCVVVGVGARTCG